VMMMMIMMMIMATMMMMMMTGMNICCRSATDQWQSIAMMLTAVRGGLCVRVTWQVAIADLFAVFVPSWWLYNHMLHHCKCRYPILFL
jgi:hypothetical protein